MPFTTGGLESRSHIACDNGFFGLTGWFREGHQAQNERSNRAPVSYGMDAPTLNGINVPSGNVGYHLIEWDANLKVFRESIRNASFCPGDAGYDVPRTIPNAMIVRCAGTADVVGSVRFVREHGALVSVRGGGHSVSGKSVCDGGVMIDLSAMKGIRVDATDRTARAEPGLTLGGGYGHLHGKYGVALDNVVSLDAVLADGRLLTATSMEYPDLYWGMHANRCFAIPSPASLDPKTKL